MRVRLLLLGMVAMALMGGGVWGWKARGAAGSGRAALAQTEAILACGPRPAGSAALTAVRGRLRAQLAAAGWVTTDQAFERNTALGLVKFENVRARFPAGVADPWQRPVTGVLCAHMDSKWFKNEEFLGADDAASACGALLEIARVLATSRPAQAQQMELVFFDGEEAFDANITPSDGLYGSRHYASEWPAGVAKPRFGVLLDMVGHKDLSIRMPSDTPQPLREAVLAAAKREGAGKVFAMAQGPIIDDHAPLNRIGIPTVDLIGDFGTRSWWHTPADNLQNLSAESLAVSIRVTLRLLDELLRGS
ncbi:MAG: M28 family peptidase [Verrucomicrobiota bacterium]